MATQIFEQQQPRYDFVQAIAQACSDMLDKASSHIEEQRNIAEICARLDQAALLAAAAYEQLQPMSPEDRWISVVNETKFRLAEHRINQSMAKFETSTMPSRMQASHENLKDHLSMLFNDLHSHYTASENDLNWFSALRDGTFDSLRHAVELTSDDYDFVQRRLESDRPNKGLERLFNTAVNCQFEIVNRH